jgi:protein required for attachment to host cells
MTTTRVLVAHDAGARIFENKGPGKGLIQLASFEFEDGRRHNGELNSDKSGRSGDRGGLGGHSFEPQQDARTHAIEHFARELAHDLGHAFRKGAFDKLVLVAPPRFLGILRSCLDPQLERVIRGTVSKDLPRADPRELAKHLAPFMAC